MTRFNPNNYYQRSPEEWSALAFQKTTENNIQWNIAGGIVLAAIATSAASPLVGGAIALWTIASSLSKAKEVQRNQAAIREHGCVAHVLEGDEFKAYLQQAGVESVEAELNFAADQRYSISDTAMDYIEDKVPQLLHPAQTRAIASATVVETQSQTHETSYIIDIVREIASPIRNCIIFGIGGSGKGMLVSNALRRIKSENPNRKIFYIDPKNKPVEYGYTNGIVDVVRRKTCEGKPPKEICAWMDEVLDEYIEWANGQEESLLIIDEGTILGGAARRCKNERIGLLIEHVSSLGGTDKKNVWLMAQSPFVESLGLKLSETSQTTAVAIVSDRNTNVLKQWSRSPILEICSQEQLTELLKHSPVKRAVFFGGNSKWGAMPELPNYSDIDRDCNKPSGDALSTEQRQSLRAATATQLKASDVMIQKLEATESATIEEFISKDLRKPSNIEELKQAIRKTLQQANRQDLLRKFF